MKATRFIGGRYLSAKDLYGEPIVGEIIEIGTEWVGRNEKDREEKLVIKVEGAEKPLALNSGNTTNLIDAYGPETDDWLGKQVRLSKQWTKFEGKRVEGLVVSAEKESTL